VEIDPDQSEVHSDVDEEPIATDPAMKMKTKTRPICRQHLCQNSDGGTGVRAGGVVLGTPNPLGPHQKGFSSRLRGRSGC